MKNALIAMIFLFSSTLAQGQGEMNNLALEPTPNLCKPGVTNQSPGKGVSVDYTYNPEFKMRPANAETASEVEANHRFSAKLKLPLVNCERAKLLLGFKYAFERYNFDDINPENYSLFRRLNAATLKDVESAAYLVVPINHRYYTSFRASASFQGDYAGFINTNADYATYRVAGIFGVKKSDDLEYGVGIYFSKNLRRAIAYPFGFLNWTLSDKWGLEAAIPVSIKMRRNLRNGDMLLFGMDYSSQNYSLQVRDAFHIAQQENRLYHYRRASMELSASLMKHFAGWTWVQFKAGYSINLNSDARDMANGLDYNLHPTGSLVGTVSFFLSPPKKCVK